MLDSFLDLRTQYLVWYQLLYKVPPDAVGFSSTKPLKPSFLKSSFTGEFLTVQWTPDCICFQLKFSAAKQ